MRIYIFLFVVAFLIGCQTQAQNASNVTNQIAENKSTPKIVAKEKSIYDVDFRNFTFPLKNSLVDNQKSITLVNGEKDFGDGLVLSLESVSYFNEYEDFQALVTIHIDDGNANDEILYVFAWENNKPKLLQTFEFSDGENISLASAFVAHGELVIETYKQLSGDSECCPSIIEISYYKWQKNKFALQGEPQKVPNGYVERIKRNRK